MVSWRSGGFYSKAAGRQWQRQTIGEREGETSHLSSRLHSHLVASIATTGVATLFVGVCGLLYCLQVLDYFSVDLPRFGVFAMYPLLSCNMM